jgi:hypothetical protein
MDSDAQPAQRPGGRVYDDVSDFKANAGSGAKGGPVNFNGGGNNAGVRSRLAVSSDDHDMGDDYDDEDELSERSHLMTPTKPPAIRSNNAIGGNPSHPSSGHGHSASSHKAGKSLGSPFDHINDDGSLALSDSGMMDNDVEEFAQSFESK